MATADRADKGRLLTDGTNYAQYSLGLEEGSCIINTHNLSARDSVHDFSVKFSPSLCVAVASLTGEMTAIQSTCMIIYIW